MIRRRLFVRFLAFVAMWAISAAVLFRLFAGPPATRGVITRAITSPAETPPDFRFLMFPGPGGTLLHDQPDGRPLEPPQPLSRALANTKEEIDADGWFRVLHTGTHRWVPAADLAYLADESEMDALVARWRDLFTLPGFGYSDVAVRITPASRAGWKVVSVRLTPVAPDPEDGRDWTEYTYETDGETAVGRSVRRYSAKGDAIGGASSAIVAAFGSSVITGIAVLAFRIARRKRGAPRTAA